MHFMIWTNFIFCSRKYRSYTEVKVDGTGMHECRELAWCKNRVSALPSDDFPHLRQNHTFHENEYRSDFVSEHVRVGRCRQPLAGHWHNVQTTRQLVEKSRMSCKQTTCYALSQCCLYMNDKSVTILRHGGFIF